MGYSFLLAARVLLYAPSHRQDSTYHILCYSSRGALAGKKNSSILVQVTLFKKEIACATVFPSDTVISMRLPNSASVFTADIWVIVKALHKLKIQLHPNTLFLQTHSRV